MASDGAATSANTSAPVFTSASYNFVAGDVGAWLFVKSGTNWTPGWYKIASVAANAATLTASVGAAALATNGWPTNMNTAAGCATTASPTGATWSVDYSQQASPISLTGLTTAAANAIILTASATKAMVGNGIVITGGTNFTTGYYSISSVSAGVSITVDRTCTSAAGASGTAGVGGAMASPGKACGASSTGNNCFFIAYNASPYLVTTASTNVAGGCLAPTAGTGAGSARTQVWGYDAARVIGYSSGNRPTLQVSGSVSSPTLLTLSAHEVGNLILDCSSKTSSVGLNGGYAVNVKILNSTQYSVITTTCIMCEVTGASTTFAFVNCTCYYCYSHANSVTGFYQVECHYCVSAANTGSALGFSPNGGKKTMNCVAYGNGGDGFHFGQEDVYDNCVAYGNSGYGASVSAYPLFQGWLAAGNNTSGATNGFSGNFLMPLHSTPAGSTIALSGDPFTNAASGDFSLNSTAGAGAACRAAGYPGVFPGATTTGYVDLGAAQHQDSGGGGLAFPVSGRVIG